MSNKSQESKSINPIIKYGIAVIAAFTLLASVYSITTKKSESNVALEQMTAKSQQIHQKMNAAVQQTIEQKEVDTPKTLAGQANAICESIKEPGLYERCVLLALDLVDVEQGEFPEEVDYIFRTINAFVEAEEKSFDVTQWGCTQMVKDPWNCDS